MTAMPFPAAWDRDEFTPAQEARMERDDALAEAVLDAQSQACPNVSGPHDIPCMRCLRCREAAHDVEQEWDEAAIAGQQAAAEALACSMRDDAWGGW